MVRKIELENNRHRKVYQLPPSIMPTSVDVEVRSARSRSNRSSPERHKQRNTWVFLMEPKRFTKWVLHDFTEQQIADYMAG